MSAQSSQPDCWKKEPVICPNCGTGLKRVREPDCIYYACPCCGGRSSTIALMRRFMPKELVNHIWQTVKRTQPPRMMDCPCCTQNMSRLPVPHQPFAIDVCSNCMLVWFDPGEYAAMPKLKQKKKSVPAGLSPELQQQLAVDRNKPHSKEEKKRRPDDIWKYIPGIMGMPVEFDHQRFARHPVATWTTALLVLALSLLFFLDLGRIVMLFGLIPAEFGRLSGFTFLTSFFIHGGFTHLFGNLYFLVIFGDNVEEYLGSARFLLLLLLSTIGGGLLYVITNPGSPIPCVGASGGIAGIMIYYALQFPKNRIGFFFLIRWLRLPVMAYIIFWVGLQFFGLQLTESRTAYGAHLGGALAGLLLWLFHTMDRRRRKQALNIE